MAAGLAKGSQTSNQIIRVAFLVEARQIRVKVLGSLKGDLQTKIRHLPLEAQLKALDNQIKQLNQEGSEAQIRQPLEVLEGQIKEHNQEALEGLVKELSQVALADFQHSLKHSHKGDL